MLCALFPFLTGVPSEEKSGPSRFSGSQEKAEGSQNSCHSSDFWLEPSQNEGATVNTRAVIHAPSRGARL